MNKRRFVLEMGMGIDGHGQDMTQAATRAVNDAITRVSLLGLSEVAGLNHPKEMIVDVLVACPRPEEVNKEMVLQTIPFGHKEIEVVSGGMVAKGHCRQDLGDKSDEIIIANAAITVSVDMDSIHKE